jgi:hypothetical protein
MLNDPAKDVERFRHTCSLRRIQYSVKTYTHTFGSVMRILKRVHRVAFSM